MKTFQLDECANSKKLRWQCKDQGLVDVLSFPKDIKNKSVKDPAVLKWFAGRSAPLVTTDARLKTDHTSDIPDEHPGIVVLCSAHRGTLTLQHKLAMLSEFKENLPGWHQLDISNVIVEIWVGNEYNVSVSRVESGQVVSEKRMRYDHAEWPDCFVLAVSSPGSRGNVSDLRT